MLATARNLLHERQRVMRVKQAKYWIRFSKKTDKTMPHLNSNHQPHCMRTCKPPCRSCSAQKLWQKNYEALRRRSEPDVIAKRVRKYERNHPEQKKEAMRKWFAKIMQNPKFRAKMRKRWAKYKRERRQKDARYRSQDNEYHRKWHAKHLGTFREFDHFRGTREQQIFLSVSDFLVSQGLIDRPLCKSGFLKGRFRYKFPSLLLALRARK